MANNLSQPITSGGLRANLLFGDPGLAPRVRDSSGEFGAWNPNIKKWQGYSNTTLSNGASATQFVYENNQNLTNLTSQAINNLSIDTRLLYKNNGTFDYRINTNVFPAAGGIQNGEGNSAQSLETIGPETQPVSNAPSDALRYPLYSTGNYDYFQITCFRYQKQDLSGNALTLSEVEERIKTSVGTVFLPMQPGISESNSVGWGNDTMNAMQIVGARIAAAGMPALSNLDPKAAAEAMYAQLQSGLGAAASDITQPDIIKYFAGQAVGANIFTRTTGQVINPNLELLFSGPNLRTFNYNYTFTPRDDDEAVQIKSIIKFFKKNMAPRKSAQGLFLETPNVFRLKYIYANGNQHPFLNKIKTCALTGFSVNYTPDGSYMTYQDGSMTSYSVNMQFNELNPIYADDYNEDTNDMGY